MRRTGCSGTSSQLGEYPVAGITRAISNGIDFSSLPRGPRVTGCLTRRVLAVALVALAACHRSAPIESAPSPITEPSPATAVAPDEQPSVSSAEVVKEAVRI